VSKTRREAYLGVFAWGFCLKGVTAQLLREILASTVMGT